MPTTRRRRSRSRIVTTLAGLSINQKLALLVAWHPPRNDFERSRPATFRDYAEVRDVYRAVRPEFVERFGSESFAEALDAAAHARPDVDVERLGLEVLERRYGAA